MSLVQRILHEEALEEAAKPDDVVYLGDKYDSYC